MILLRKTRGDASDFNFCRRSFGSGKFTDKNILFYSILIKSSFLIAQALTATNATPVNANQIDVFGELDDFSLVIIFESLNFCDLANVAVLNPRYSEIIVTRILPKYQLNDGKIDVRLFSNPSNSTAILHWHEKLKEGHSTLARGHNSTYGVLKSFGYVFTQMKIHVREQAITDWEELTKYTDSPDGKHNNVIFPNVIELLLDIDYKNPPTMQLDKVFPHLEQLSIRGFISHFPFSFSGSSKYLTQFQSREPIYDPDRFKSFLRSNPQLRNLTVPIKWTHNYIREIGEYLPNLEDLHIIYDGSLKGKSSNDNIRMKNVKKFTLELSYNDDYKLAQSSRDVLKTIVFDKLETFKMSANIDGISKYLIDLIGQNKNLVRVELAKFEVSDMDLNRLVKQLPKLKDIILHHPSARDTWDLMRFLEHRTQLERIYVTTNVNDVDLFFHVEREMGERAYRIIPDTNNNFDKFLIFERRD